MSPDTDYALINRDGYWLTVSGKQARADFQLDPNDQISREHPAAWEAILNVITSYSIHYTKLYESLFVAQTQYTCS